MRRGTTCVIFCVQTTKIKAIPLRLFVGKQGIAVAPPNASSTRYSLPPTRTRPFAFQMTSLRRNQYIFYGAVRGQNQTGPRPIVGGESAPHAPFAKTSTMPATISQLTRKYNGRGTSHEAQDRRPRRAYVGEVLFVRHGCSSFFFL